MVIFVATTMGTPWYIICGNEFIIESQNYNDKDRLDSG